MWSDGGTHWVSIGDMTRARAVRATDRFVTPRGIADKRLTVGRPGTILFAMYASVGALAILGVEAAWNQAILGIRPKKGLAEARFVAYWLEHLRPDLAALTRSNTQDNLNAEQVGNFPFPVVPLERQTAAADYLDTETGRIDALIEKKQRMVELLQGASVTAIEEALCTDKSSPTPLRRLLAEPPEYGASEAGVEGDADWPRYVRITDLTADGALRDDDIRRLPPAAARRYLLNDQDVLIARSGATVGKAFLYVSPMGPCCFAGYLIRFRFDPNLVLPKLVALWTRTGHYWRQIQEASVQATIENVSAERYKELIFPLPPLPEQQQLIHNIERRRDRTERLRAKLTRQLQLLTEHRQALITAAVTGQLDIPDTAGVRPDEDAFEDAIVPPFQLAPEVGSEFDVIPVDIDESAARGGE